MSSGLLSIGSSALNAAYTALRTTGNNIANVNTPGYSRQVVDLSAQVETNIGGNYLGSGVAVDSVKRVYSDFLAQQTNLAQAMSSQADTRSQMLTQVDNLFADPTTGLGAAVDQFFSQVQAVTQQPGDAAARQAMLSSAQQLAGRFNDISGQLQQMSNSADLQMNQAVSTVNTTVSQIAALNDQIALASAGGATPNGLLDQRGQLIQTLNQSIGVTAVAQSNGAINLFLANGQPLVIGDQVTKLATGVDPNDPQQIQVGTAVGKTIVPLDPNNSGGGAVGALLQFRAQDLPAVENQIGRLAVTLSSQFNAQHSLGQDQNGAPGGNFFSAPSIAVVPAASNPDSATVSLSATYSDTTQLQASDYRLAVTAGGYQLTRLSDGTTRTLPSLPATVDGMTLSFSAAPAKGDVFTIEPVRNGAAAFSVAITQISQIAAASPLQATAPSTNQGTLAVGNLTLQPPPSNPNLLQPVALNFTSPTQFTYTAGGTTSPVQTYTPGQPIQVNGWSLTLTGTPAVGDQVNVSASGSGSGDNRNALQLAQLQQLPLLNGVQLGSAYSAVIAQVGALAASAQTDQQSRQTMLQDAVSAQSSVSGVNLDQEAAQLLQYQQQYQAAAKLIQTASNMFDAILQVAAAA
jgi:flagellar hook-associated protein 1 FlgK